jgi:predicted RND superfamily exporter protein
MGSTRAGMTYDATQMASLLSSLMPTMSEAMVSTIYLMYFSNLNYDNLWVISLFDFMTYLVNDMIMDPAFSGLIDAENALLLTDSYSAIVSGKNQLIGPLYSRMILTTSYSLSDDLAIPYVNDVSELLDDLCVEYYLIGNLPMAAEMNDSFLGELNFITLLTIIAIFVIVAFTFKSLFVPLLLVTIIQTSIYLTMSITLIGGKDLYFLSVIVVQAILMGAAIDYAILFTNYYRNCRATMDIKSAIKEAYQKSLPAILTSSIILIVITGILGIVVDNATTASVLKTLSRGTLISILMTLTVLPPLLTLFDKLVCFEFGKKKNKEKTE